MDNIMGWLGKNSILGSSTLPGTANAVGAPLAALAVQVAPEVGPHLSGPSGAAVEAAFMAVLGTVDPVEAGRILAEDASRKADLGSQLAKVAAETATVVVPDLVEPAKEDHAVFAASDHSPWVQSILAGSVVLLLILVLCIFAFVDIPKANEQALNIVLGSLTAAFAAVVGYYFGSSSGSARKDFLIAQNRQNK